MVPAWGGVLFLLTYAEEHNGRDYQEPRRVWYQEVLCSRMLLVAEYVSWSKTRKHKQDVAPTAILTVAFRSYPSLNGYNAGSLFG